MNSGARATTFAGRPTAAQASGCSLTRRQRGRRISLHFGNQVNSTIRSIRFIDCKSSKLRVRLQDPLASTLCSKGTKHATCPIRSHGSYDFGTSNCCSAQLFGL